MDLVLSITNLRDPRMLDVSHGRLDGTTIVYTNRLLRKVRVTVDRGRQVPAGKDRYLKMELKGSGLKFLSARTHTFEVEGRVVSVEVGSPSLPSNESYSCSWVSRSRE